MAGSVRGSSTVRVVWGVDTRGGSGCHWAVGFPGVGDSSGHDGGSEALHFVMVCEILLL